jgi:hypothetical protein
MLAIFLERVGNVDHPVSKVVGPVKCLLRCLMGIGECTNDTQRKVLVDFPIEVRVEFECYI